MLARCRGSPKRIFAGESRGATYATGGNAVFTNDTIAILLEADNTAYQNTELCRLPAVSFTRSLPLPHRPRVTFR